LNQHAGQLLPHLERLLVEGPEARMNAQTPASKLVRCCCRGKLRGTVCCTSAQRRGAKPRIRDTQEGWLLAIRRLMKAQDELADLRRRAEEDPAATAKQMPRERLHVTMIEKKQPAPSIRRATPQMARSSAARDGHS